MSEKNFGKMNCSCYEEGLKLCPCLKPFKVGNHCPCNKQQRDNELSSRTFYTRAFALSHKLDFGGEIMAHMRSNKYKHFLFHNFFSHNSYFVKICLERNHKINPKSAIFVFILTILKKFINNKKISKS